MSIDCGGYPSPDRQEQCPRCHQPIHDGSREATRLLGFALFNHAKGNQEATGTLMRKAYKALSGTEWDAVSADER